MGFRHALICLLVAAPAAAQDFSGIPEPLVTDRPDFTESTSTVPRGHFQIEGGFTSARVDEEEAQSLGEILIRIGAGERVEARIGAGSYTRLDTGLPGEDRITGFEDPFLGMKVRLTPGDPDLLPPGRPTMALLLSASLPAGNEDLTADAWVPEAKLALSWELTPRVSLGSNLNYAYAVDGGDRFHQLAGSLTSGISLTDRLGMFVEYFGFSEETDGGPDTHYLNGGTTFGISNDLQLDARIGFGLNEASPDWFAGVGAAVRF
jgi:hypothetical protein